jgi:hypothetical protein
MKCNVTCCTVTSASHLGILCLASGRRRKVKDGPYPAPRRAGHLRIYQIRSQAALRGKIGLEEHFLLPGMEKYNLHFPTGCATRCEEDVNRLHRRVQSSRFLAGSGGEFFQRQANTIVYRTVKSYFTDEIKLVAHPVGRCPVSRCRNASISMVQTV